MPFQSRAIVLLACLILSACGHSEPIPETKAPGSEIEAETTMMETASEAPSAKDESRLLAGPRSSLPSFGESQDGRLYLAWVGPDETTESALRWSVWEGEAWSPARTAIDDPNMIGHWTAAPSVAFSDDGGASFGPARQVDRGNPAGQVDVVLRDDGSALVSWMDGDGVVLAHVDAEGSSDGPLIAAISDISLGFGRPRLGRLGDSVFLAWASGEGLYVSRIEE
jgi:hypothetical protein